MSPVTVVPQCEMIELPIVDPKIQQSIISQNAKPLKADLAACLQVPDLYLFEGRGGQQSEV